MRTKNLAFLWLVTTGALACSSSKVEFAPAADAGTGGADSATPGSGGGGGATTSSGGDSSGGATSGGATDGGSSGGGTSSGGASGGTGTGGATGGDSAGGADAGSGGADAGSGGVDAGAGGSGGADAGSGGADAGPCGSGCDDSNPCTSDACTALGCTNLPLAYGSGCPDGDGDSNTFGICVDGACTAIDACADGSREQQFAPGIVGCAAMVPYSERASECGARLAACPASEWTAEATVAPTHNYWTDTDLRYAGLSNACTVDPDIGTACGYPMRICAGATDPEGNTCNWTGCALTGATGNAHFGGCAADSTAGTACCLVEQGCADGTVEDAFSQAMVGCATTNTFPNRAAACAGGYHVCTADEWALNFGNKPPTHNYWTDDVLGYTGASGACSVSTSGGTACPVDTPMRVCAGITDPEGNTCGWIGCGLETQDNQYFGGCSTNTTAGTLCCKD